MTTAMLFLLALLVALVEPAYAYVDPGSVSVLIQFLIAAVAGGMLAFRSHVSRIFRSVFAKKKDDGNEPADGDPG